MARITGSGTYTVGATLGAAQAIPIDRRGAMFIAVPTGSSINSIQVYAQAIVDGEYVPVGDAVAGTAPYGESFTDAFGALNVKLVGNAAGTAQVRFTS